MTEPRTIQKVRAFIESLDAPISIRSIPDSDVKAVQELIAQRIVGVTNDWKLWPLGKALPK